MISISLCMQMLKNAESIWKAVRENIIIINLYTSYDCLTERKCFKRLKNVYIYNT